jgi:hypothetical protein
MKKGSEREGETGDWSGVTLSEQGDVTPAILSSHVSPIAFRMGRSSGSSVEWKERMEVGETSA